MVKFACLVLSNIRATALLTVTSPGVINVYGVETKDSFVLWLAQF